MISNSESFEYGDDQFYNEESVNSLKEVNAEYINIKEDTLYKALTKRHQLHYGLIKDVLTKVEYTKIFSDNLDNIKHLIKITNLNEILDSVSKKTYLHFTSLQIGNISDMLEITKLLIENGADVNATNDSDRTPLHTITKHSNNLEAIKLLVENGADVNAIDYYGHTPLINSVSTVNININSVKYLIENGADVNIHTKAGCALTKSIKGDDYSSYCVAKSNEITELLINTNADLGLVDEYNRTALAIATKGNNDYISNLIR